MSTPLAEADLPWIDFAGDRFRTDPVGVLREARERSWLAGSTRGPQVLTHGAICRLVLDPHFDSVGDQYYREQGGSAWVLEYATNSALPLIPGARHDRIKKALQRGFTLKRVNEMRVTMRAIAERLIDRMVDRGLNDLVPEFSHHYPIQVLCALMGVPEKDIERFEHWTVSLGYLASYPIGPHLAEIDAALEGLYGYLRELVEYRRRTPENDYVSALIDAQAQGEDLSEAELLGALVNLLFAGHDTTRYQFGWVIQRLMGDRRQWDMVVNDPTLATGAVDEAMRMEPSLTGFLRRVIEEVDFDGIRLPVGTILWLNSYAANYDPAVFPAPETYDIRRANAARHVTFGYGPHLCLGNTLARAEMSEALQIFARRFPRLDLAGSPEFPADQATTSAMRGAEHLPLALRA